MGIAHDLPVLPNNGVIQLVLSLPKHLCVCLLKVHADPLQGFVAVYEGEEKRYKAARLLPGHKYKARVKVTIWQSGCMLLSGRIGMACA